MMGCTLNLDCMGLTLRLFFCLFFLALVIHIKASTVNKPAMSSITPMPFTRYNTRIGNRDAIKIPMISAIVMTAFSSHYYHPYSTTVALRLEPRNLW